MTIVNVIQYILYCSADENEADEANKQILSNTPVHKFREIFVRIIPAAAWHVQ